MSKTPTFQSAMRRHVLHLLFVLCFPFFVKADVGISVSTSQVGDLVTADILVTDFDDILSIQYALSWDPNELQFLSVGNFNLPTMTNTNFGITQTDAGIIRFSWTDSQFGNTATVPDCNPIYSINFKLLGNQIPAILLDPSLMIVEVYNGQEQQVSLEQNTACGNYANVSGKIFKDENSNCTKEEDEEILQDCSLKFTGENSTFYISPNQNGTYFFNCPAGNYEVVVILPENNIWTPCQPSFSLTLNENQQLEQNFGAYIGGGNTSGTFDNIPGSFSIRLLGNPIQSGRPINIESQTRIAGDLQLQIFDTSGKLMHQSQQNVQAGVFDFSIQTPLLQGLYLLRVSDEHGTLETKRLMVY